MIRTLITVAALLAATSACASGPGSVALTFETASDTGAVMVALYDEATYNGGQPIRTARVDIAAGDRTATFDGLAEGEYGVKVFHDLNGNGRMDTGPSGMPSEPYAFSNNAIGNRGPAGWDVAKFTVDGATAQTITVR